MIKKSLFAAFTACFTLTLSINCHAQDTVVIIRHGEKPTTGDNLSCKGLNRALGIPSSLLSKFSVPLYTYVPTVSCGKETKHSRMFQTVTPMATRCNFTVNSKHDVDATSDVANAVMGKLGSIQPKGIILMVWEHKNILKIAKAMNVKNVPDWQGSDFDSIWIITNAGKSNAKLNITSEGLNGVSDSCPN